MASLEGKVIAITGASGGMGLTTARLLASRGASLSLSDVNEPELNDLKASLDEAGTKKLYTTHKVDVSDSAQVDAWIEETVTRHGRLDGAVNLAGIDGNYMSLLETTDEQWAKVLGINLNGTMFAMRAQIREMKKTGGGMIVNCASVAGLLGLPQMSPYVASKHAVIGLTKSVAREHGEDGIRIVALAPGIIDTPMARPIIEYLRGDPNNIYTNRPCIKRSGTTEEIAEFVAFLLSDQAKFFTGSTLNIDGGWAA